MWLLRTKDSWSGFKTLSKSLVAPFGKIMASKIKNAHPTMTETGYHLNETGYHNFPRFPDFILTTLDQLKPTGYHRGGKKRKRKSSTSTLYPPE